MNSNDIIIFIIITIYRVSKNRHIWVELCAIHTSGRNLDLPEKFFSLDGLCSPYAYEHCYNLY